MSGELSRGEVVGMSVCAVHLHTFVHGMYFGYSSNFRKPLCVSTSFLTALGLLMQHILESFKIQELEGN